MSFAEVNGVRLFYELTGDLAALIEALDLAPAHVAGNSLGSIITLRLASRRPELFRTVAVHEPPAVYRFRDGLQLGIAVHQRRAMGRASTDVIDEGVTVTDLARLPTATLREGRGR